MKRNFVLIAAAGYALTALTSVALAAPKGKMAMSSHKKVASATLKCPACGMPMPMKKSAMMTVPVKVGKKTYYCCPMCPAGKKAAAALHKKSA
jgi:hypothetical protein